MPPMSDVRVVESSQQLASLAAGLLADWCARAVAARGRCHLALAGGTTPRPVYALLAGPPLRDRVDWTRVEFYFGDERKVPQDHLDSNFRMACETLLDPLGMDPARVHRMEVERADAAARYEALLPERLDVLVLGIGADGHTASLFPGDPAVLETERRVLAVTGPKPPPERLTITAPVIRAARRRLVLASGRAKARAIQRALHDDPDPLSTPAVLARQGVWLLTADAVVEG